MCRSFIYALYFWVSLIKKKKKKEEDEQNLIFAFDFLDYEEKSWDTGTIFDIRIAKGFHL